MGSDDEINVNIQSLNVQQRQDFDFVYSCAKDTVKQKNSVKPNLVKPFNLFLSGSGGVGKSHLTKKVLSSMILINSKDSNYSLHIFAENSQFRHTTVVC